MCLLYFEDVDILKYLKEIICGLCWFLKNCFDEDICKVVRIIVKIIVSYLRYENVWIGLVYKFDVFDYMLWKKNFCNVVEKFRYDKFLFELIRKREFIICNGKCVNIINVL